MQTVKHKRNYWTVEPGIAAAPYASLELGADYDNTNVWTYGWHVRLRDRDGLTIEHGGVHATRKNAAAAAIALLSR